jgi:hypothetical protein
VSATAGINWTDIILGSAAAVSAVAAWVSVHFTRRSHVKEDKVTARIERAAEMKQAVKDGFQPLDSRILALEAQCNAMPVTIDSLIVRALKPIEAQLVMQNTKIEPVWRALEELAVDMAKNLHHPDFDRAELDDLLDHFMAGTLTSNEDLTLRRYLNKIKTVEAGYNTDLGFTVYDGEPTYAAILLRTMELSRIRISQRTQQNINEWPTGAKPS